MSCNCNPLALGLSIGFIWAISLLIVSILNVASNWGGNTLFLVSEWYLGYDLTMGGMLVGTIWAFFDGFIGGFLVAWLYNAFNQMLSMTKK